MNHFLHGFQAELVKVGSRFAGREVADDLVGRMAAMGALAGAGKHVAHKGLAAMGMTYDPAATGDTLLKNVGMTAAGGVGAGLLLRALLRRRR